MTADAAAAALRWPMRIGCHDSDRLRIPAAWEPRPNADRLACSGCSSMHPGSLYRLLGHVQPSPPPWERSSGAERAYAEWLGVYLAKVVDGWPRRFYVLDRGQQLTFDARHLDDLDGTEFGAVVDLLARHAGVQFGRTPDGRLTYTGVI